MSRIRGKHTKPERQLRSALHAMGLRYRLHVKALPGCPDIVLPRWRAVVMVHGCFWHGHDCPDFKWPKTRPEFWREKILGNQARDALNREFLTKAGWRVMIVWECSLRHHPEPLAVASAVAKWLNSVSPFAEVRH
jgi:DNA mismatch endonuclease (patch repair protein)